MMRPRAKASHHSRTTKRLLAPSRPRSVGVINILTSGSGRNMESLGGGRSSRRTRIAAALRDGQRAGRLRHGGNSRSLGVFLAFFSASIEREKKWSVCERASRDSLEAQS
ncbi:hypothetical protein MTO96_033351 [Rhipicephalus appendiculatus]